MSRERNIKSTKKSEKIESDHDDYTSAQKEKDVSVSKPSGVQTFAKIYYVLMPVLVVIIAGLLTFAVTRQETATIVKRTTKETGTGTGGKAKETPKKEVLLTAEELAKHDGSDPNIPVYLAILGRIYDVDKGKRHYEVDSGYNVFAGRDSTPSFVTGKFAREDATDVVKGLSPEDMMGVKGWLDFYRKDYTYVGKLMGRYYDSEGKPTEALQEAKALIKEGQRLQKLQDAENKRFPGCNSRWSKDEGSLVWCSENRYVFRFSVMLGFHMLPMFLQQIKVAHHLGYCSHMRTEVASDRGHPAYLQSQIQINFTAMLAVKTCIISVCQQWMFSYAKQHQR